MLQCVLSFQSKVWLLISNLQSAEFTHHFPKLACITTERPELKDHYRPDVFGMYMTQLGERFEARFGDFCNRKVLFNFLQNPFVVPVRTELAQMGTATANSDSELLELQADFDMQAIPSTCSVPEFWFKVPQEKCPTLVSCAFKGLSIFSSTYVCETRFSAINSINNKHGNRLRHDHLQHCLRAATTSYEPRYQNITSKFTCFRSSNE
ncbi:SCAN domain-containing protein 3 [Acipenser ruthenus]|uniref:SCAN domain-containing protein 3 n=1 Tax=Acipenser ruthenus TaxID=7906 RepID=A0A444UFR6_ACIRT|nr:SCAN domain-containing protein 3 [Acipenser ruthenus]